MSATRPFEVDASQYEEVRSWPAYESLVRDSKFRGWMYRGQASAEWPVLSSLSRRLRTYGVHPEVWAVQERRILKLFQRKAHLFLDHIPASDDYFQWLALMQHHGAPTRLLDFTWSPEVAAFFALESASPGGECAVWAVATPKLWNATYSFGDRNVDAKNLSLRDPANYEAYYLNNTVPFVSTDDPFVMNQRIIAQSGTFLVPGVLDKPIEHILKVLSEQSGERSADWVFKIGLNVDRVRSDGMAALYRMNTSNATLFPGLDGTARSLAYELERHWAFDATTNVAKGEYESEFEDLKGKRLS